MKNETNIQNSPLEAIRKLRRLVTYVEQSDEIPSDLAIWLKTGVSRYEHAVALGAGSLESALGLKPRGGGGGWLAQERRERRDQALRSLRASQFSRLPDTVAAQAILKHLADSTRRPMNEMMNKLDPLTLEILSSGAAIPDYKQILNIIRNKD